MRRIAISIAAASSAVLLMASISPAHAVILAPEITFSSPVAAVKHIGTCKHGSPPCDTFKVTAPFQVTNDVDLDDDLSNQEVALVLATGQTCVVSNLGSVFEIIILAGHMVRTTSGSHVKYTFSGNTGAHDFSHVSVTVPLNLSITINTKTGKGVLKASATGDFAAITASPISFALVPFNEPDSDNDPDVNNGDFNCGVTNVSIKMSK